VIINPSTQRVLILEQASYSPVMQPLKDHQGLPNIEISFAPSDEEFRLMFHREVVDMAILDIALTDLVVMDILVYISEKLSPKQFIPIYVLIDDSIAEDDLEKLLHFGVAGYIRKNITTTEVLQNIKSALRAKKTHDQIAEKDSNISKNQTDMRITLAELTPQFEIPKAHRGKIEVCGKVIPSSRLGGDALFFRPQSDGRFSFALLDSAVYGLDAIVGVSYQLGLLEAGFQQISSDESGDVLEVAKLLNRLYYEMNHGQLILKAIIGLIDLNEQQIEFVSLGYPDPIFVSKTKKQIQSYELNRSVPLGVDLDSEFHLNKISLESIARMLFISNGFIEQRQESDFVSILPLVENVVSDTINQPARILAGKLETEFDKQQPDAEFKDDAAYMIVDLL